MMIGCVRLVFLDIWGAEPCVCVWPSWLSRPTISSTVNCHAVLFSTRI